MQDDPTLPEIAGPSAHATELVVEKRYRLGTPIGAGGMGEVRLAKDVTIDRDVAIKLMRGTADDAQTIARFFREARVQGRLDHPAVVPVHDLGIDATGQPYFVMKRLAGTTLADVLAQGTTPQRTLLARLVDICLAIDFAHARGVVHRDLKPANIMLGDHGEAYVLDWGLARIVGDSSPFHGASAVSGTETQAGALLGTPGYMAPEQARGEDVDGGTDVFALGCILYEILAGAPALPRGLAAIEPTLASEAHRPSARADVPPELDEWCARATAQDRGRRPTARALADGIQGYLDGDRDVARRRALAADHAAQAQAALAHGDEAGRARAMREAGRAFVLDPANQLARDVIAALTLEAPKQIPAEALAAADHARATARGRTLRWGAVCYAGGGLGIALLFYFPVRHAWPIVATVATAFVLAGTLWWMARRLWPMRTPWYLWILFLNTSLLIGGAFVFGPLLIMPIYVCGSLGVYLVAPARFHPATIIVAHVVAMVVPVVLELAGVLPRTFQISDNQLVLTPFALDLPPWGLALVLVLATAAQLTNTAVISLGQRSIQEAALDAVHAQSWHLKQLLPGAGDASTPPAATELRSTPPSRAA